MVKRKFSDEMKKNAVRMVVEKSVPVTKAAKEWGISTSTLRRWVREQKSHRKLSVAEAGSAPASSPAKPAGAMGTETILFDGDDIRIVASYHGSDAVVLSFSPRPQRPGDNLRGFGRDFFDGQGITGIYVVAHWANWWQSAEMEAAIEAVRKSGLVRDARHSMAYGGSMGGFGALKYAEAFECKRALIVSPQVSIDPADIPFETRWAEDLSKLTLRDPDSRTGLGNDCRYTVIFDPFDLGDAKHVALLPKHPQLQLLSLPFCSHSPLMFFKEVGYLKTLVLKALVAQPDFADIRSQSRKGRRGSPTYLAGVAVAANRNKHMALACWAAGARFDLDPASPGGFYAYARLFGSDGQYEKCVSVADRHLEAHPGSRHGLVQRRNALINLQRTDEALEVAEELLRLGPDASITEDDWRVHATILNRLRRGSQARRIAEAGIRRHGRTPLLLCAYIEAVYFQKDREKFQELFAEMMENPNITLHFKNRMQTMLERL
jgi:hypothetical protein